MPRRFVNGIWTLEVLRKELIEHGMPEKTLILIPSSSYPSNSFEGADNGVYFSVSGSYGRAENSHLTVYMQHYLSGLVTAMTSIMGYAPYCQYRMPKGYFRLSPTTLIDPIFVVEWLKDTKQHARHLQDYSLSDDIYAVIAL